MKLSKIIFLLFCLIPLSYHSAGQESDSAFVELYNQLALATEDTSRVSIMIDMAYQYAPQNFDSSYKYASEALELAKQIEYKRGISSGYVCLATANLYTYDLEEAKDQYLKAIEPTREVNDTLQLLVIYRILGNIYYSFGDYASALDYWLIGLNLALETEAREFIPEYYHNLGALYNAINDYDRAFEYFKLCRETTMKYKITDMYPNAWNNMAMIESKRGDFEKVSRYAREILAMQDSVPNTINFVPSAYEHLGNSAYHQAKYDSALYFYGEMLKHLEVLDEMYFGPVTIEEVIAHTGIGECYMAMQQWSLAKDNLLKAYHLAKDMGYLKHISELSELLAVVYENMGNAPEALKYQKEFKVTSDSLLNEDNIQKIAMIRMESEFNDRERKLRYEQERKERIQKERETWYVFVIIGISLVLVIFILLYRLQRVKTSRETFKRDNIQMKLDFKNQELASHALNILKKNELLIKLTDKLKAAKIKSKASNKALIDDMINEINISSLEIGWEEFELRFKEVHADFYEKLTSKFPDLSTNELRLCAFTRLNMSTKDISALTLQSTHSINVARSRMRKKMGIGNNESLSAFLNKL